MSVSNSPKPFENRNRHPQRVRHELRFRLLEVQHSERLTPHMIRVTLGGDDIEGFTSPGFDDHIKIFMPAPGESVPTFPELGEQGPVFPEGRPHPIVRDFTPRIYDPASATLQIDFAIHESGPASYWACNAKPGDILGVAGPRGSFLVPTDFDWHLLIGDETALPAIARRLEELPAGTRAVVLAEVGDKDGELTFETQADLSLRWVHRATANPGMEPLVEALGTIALPDGDYYAWVACETGVAKRLRQRLITDLGANPKWLRVAGYWRRGEAGAHERFEE